MKVEYSSNNSGGSWWLKDEDWHKLAIAGWNVDWVQTNEYKQGGFGTDRGSDGKRWLGALATGAFKTVKNRKEANDAIREFEELTGQNVDDQGCNCCGPPHYFSLTGDDGSWIASFESEPVQYERRYF